MVRIHRSSTLDDAESLLRDVLSVAASANANAYTLCANDGAYSPGDCMFASHAESSRMTAMM
jgi:hypothetical protein